MKVRLAKNAGFCPGVRRALNLVLDTIKRRDGPIYTYGSLIHNPQVIELLRKKGVGILRDTGRIEKDATVIIRSHGVSPEEYERIRSKGVRICNATCPKVSRVQAIVRRYAKEGYVIAIIGDKGHAETKGLLGYAGGKGIVVATDRDVEDIPKGAKICVVAQTTQAREKFNRLSKRIEEKSSETLVFDTICDYTSERQREALKLSEKVEAMVVVGGYNSANTKRLAQLLKEKGVPTFHIETEEELDMERLRDFKTVGVTAGASTPNWLIQRVVARLKEVEGRNILYYLSRIMGFLVWSNIYVAAGAASLSYATSRLQGFEPRILFEWIAASYIFGMHLLNHFTDWDAVGFNEPERVRFYTKYKRELIGIGIASTLLSLFFSFWSGLWLGVFVLFISLLGLSYRVNIIPKSWRFRYRRLMDIPASKDFLLALAWAVVLVFLHLLSVKGRLSPATFIAFGFAFVLAFTRSLLFSIKDFEGDRMIGRETVPIIIGLENTKKLITSLISILTLTLLLSAGFGLISPLGYWLILPLGYIFILTYLHYNKVLSPGVGWEIIVDGTFLLSIAIAYGWYKGFF